MLVYQRVPPGVWLVTTSVLAYLLIDVDLELMTDAELAIALSLHMNFQLPSGYVKIAIENGPFIVDLPIKHGDFPLLC